MTDSIAALQPVIEQCQQTLNLVNADVAVLNAVVSIVEGGRYHVRPVPACNVTEARSQLQALQSISWRLRFCCTAAKRTSRRAVGGRPVPAEDIQAFHDYLALALQDFTQIQPYAAAV